uniref:Uncharacterized protein n=1 Tax=Oryza rufipogon TaxID=4529 RepID=A0A0E0QK19_ORYRU
MRKPRRRQGGSGCGTPRQQRRQWQRGMQRPRRRRGMKRLRRRRLRDTKVAAMEVWDAEAAATTTVLCLSVDFAATIFNLSIRWATRRQQAPVASVLSICRFGRHVSTAVEGRAQLNRSSR